MKYLLLLTLSLVSYYWLSAQRVGINTNTPARTLSVNGSVLVDQQNTNLGNLDSAALLLGTNGVGIFSNRNPSVTNYNGLDIWTANARRITVNTSGWVGIGLGTTSPAYFLDVNGTIRSRTNLRADAGLIIGGNANIGGTLTVTETTTLNNNLVVSGTASVGGKGIVRSNSSTNLRMGFSSGAFGITLNPGQTTDILFNIVAFAGDNDNIRVAISQFAPDASSGDSWGKIVMTVHSVDAAANQCKIRFHNPSSAASTMIGRLYLMSVATD